MKISLTRRVGMIVLVAAMPVAAQINLFQKVDQAEIQRSRDIQAQVARIDQNKATFINNFIASWVPFVNTRIFGDVSSELRPLLEAATPWRLYAASLVGDYNGMVQVLRGEVAAGKVINTLSEPQPHAMATAALTTGSASPLAPLGSTTTMLVFTPIPPCRVADTRPAPPGVPGARTGILTPGVPRTFDLTTGAFGKGQGAPTSSCPGLPSFSNYAWSLNITVTGYTGNGFLQVYPFGGAVPATSISNYGPALPAIPNSSTVTGCYGCADDITVLASAAATHVILDVYGYFEVPTGFTSGVVTRLAGTTATVAAGVYSRVDGAACPSGTRVIGGAQTNSSSSTNTVLTSDHSVSGTNWYEFVKNTGSSSASVTVYSICQDAQ